MNRNRLVLSLTGLLLLAAAAPGLCESRYATDLGITRYVIRLDPDFDHNRVACRVRALVQNFSSRAMATVEIDLRSGADASTIDHEMRSITLEQDGRKEPADFTVSRKQAEGSAGAGHPAYVIRLNKALDPGGRVWLEFDYELRGKPQESSFPIFENARGVKELYLMSDYQWLPRISYQAPPNVFANTCRPAWTLTVAYPSSSTSVVDGELVRKDEARGVQTEEWKSVAGVLPQVFIAPYDLIRGERNGLKLEMALAREDGLKSQAASAVDDVFNGYYRNALLKFKADTFFMYPARSAEMKQYPVIEQPGYESRGIVSASYRKGPLVLDEIRRELGDSLFFACLGHFARTHKDGNATMADFVRAFDETSKKNLDASFRELCWNAEAASYEIVAVTSVPSGNHFATTVRIRNTGGMSARCPILLAMRDGERREQFICAPGTATELHYDTPAEVTRAVLDPDLEAFEYRADEKYRAWAKLDEETFAGNNWAWFNKSYALYRLGMVSEAVRTLTTYFDRFMATGGIAGIRELGRDPVRASYLFSRGLYHQRQNEANLAEADIKASIPGLALLLTKGPIAVATYSEIVDEKTPEQDLASLLGLLTGKVLSLGNATTGEAKQLAIQEWLKWWDEQGNAARLNLKALDRYPTGLPNE